MLNVKLSPYNAVGNGVADDTAAIQAALTAAPAAGYRVFIPTGTYGITDELMVPDEVHIIGEGHTSHIKALAGFSFPDNEHAMIHQVTAASGPVTYAPGSDLGRMYLKDIYVNGNNIAGSKGILASLQQPSHWEDVRIGNCATEGLVLVEGQQATFSRLMIIACGTGVFVKGHYFTYFFDLDVEQHTVEAVKMDASNSLVPRSCSFYNVHIESGHGATKEFNVIQGTNLTFDNCFFSANASTLFHFADMSSYDERGPVYSIRNAAQNGDPTNVKMLVDVSRGIDMNCFTGFRNHIPFLMAGNEDVASAPWPGPPTGVRIAELSNNVREL